MRPSWLKTSLTLITCSALWLPALAPAAAADKPAAAGQAAAQVKPPKLVVVMVIDGLPAEQVQRYRDQFGPGGLRRLLEQGASFTDAHQAHGITVTAIGHSAVLTGAYPYRHGIIGNNWIDAESMRLPVELSRANDKLVQSGRTTMVVRKGARFLGVIGVMDTPRPAAPSVMKQLRELGIERLVMLSGDNQQVADAVARTVGLTEAKGDLMPEQKVETVKALRERHGKVAMVGDGVNDAPAMANATVGIAMGAAGSDVALEAADVALMSDDLSQLPFAVGLSRRTRRVIKQNLWVSLGVVAVLIPATIFGLNIGTAVLFHEGSTLLVVINALRLLAYPGTATGPDQRPAPPTKKQAVGAAKVSS
ncbi:hypothetical protein GCM10025794_06970 [Massilia kyonggiensis]